MNTQGAMIFIVSTVFDFAVFLVLTRFLLQLVQADFYNPVSQFVVRVSDPLLRPLRKLIPGTSQIDGASLFTVLALIVIKILVIYLMQAGTLPPLAPLLLFSLRTLATLLLSYLFWAVLIRVILSWVAPDPYHPVVKLIGQLTEPVMAPARKILPPLGGLDLSPLLVILFLQFMMILFGGGPRW